MPDQTPILALPVLVPNQAQPYVTHNEALRRLDILVQLSVLELGAEMPPALPEEGDLYALGAAPVAGWAGQAYKLAAWIDGAWLFLAPQDGWRAWDRDTGVLRIWDGAGWVRPPADLDNVAGLGIGTAADPVNRLAVKSDAVLFSHDGAGHQLKINKAGDSDTASLLFQSGWTGHAEIGLAGDSDLVLKVSADGSAWTEALRFDAASGEAFGAAVQSGPADTSAGRIPKMGNDADFDGLTFGSISDGASVITGILGTVSQSGGNTTGALIEYGSNANGEYLRLADGTQICWANRTTAYITSNYCAANFSFPAAFSAVPVTLVTLDTNTWGTDVPSGLSRADATATRGNKTTAGSSVQTWAASGSVFGASDAPKVDCIAIGRWF